MALWSQFVSGTYQSRSPTLDAEQCVNLMPVTIDSASNAKKAMLLGTPGLRRLLSVGTTQSRGLFSEDGRTWACIGGTLYELDLTANTATSRGSIADDGKPVSFASNGRGGEQLAICGGGSLYVLDLETNVLTGPIAVPLTNAAVQIAFIDGYCLLLEANTVRWWFSALENFESWDALDFVARSQTSDNYVGLGVVRDRVWVWGGETTDLYYNSGNSDNPFLPYPGAIIYEGLVGPDAWTTDGQSMFWLAQNSQGRGYMVQGTDGQVRPISTDAIDFAVAQATTLEDVEAMAFLQEGHTHICWTLPSCQTCGFSPCFDTKEGLWHQHASFDVTLDLLYRWRVRGLASTSAGLIVGDHETGDIYELDLDTFTENGNPIKRVRRAPYLSSDAVFGFLDQFELGAQMGVGLNQGQGSDPQVMFRRSIDAGQTWSPALMSPIGKMGAYGNRCVWRRLGRARLDRLVCEVSVTDPVRIIFGPGAWLKITEGSQAL